MDKVKIFIFKHHTSGKLKEGNIVIDTYNQGSPLVCIKLRHILKKFQGKSRIATLRLLAYAK